MSSSKNLQRQIFPNQGRITALLLLSALLLAVFAPNLAYAVKVPEGMVYCPLSKRFQPILPSPEIKNKEPFIDICASPARKHFLIDEIVINNPFSFSLNIKRLDDLAFDLLAHGKSALKILPEAPKLPIPTIFKKVISNVVTNNRYDHKIIWNTEFQYSSPTLLARPPTATEPLSFAFNSIVQSPEVSRHLAPRAPPLFS